MTGAAFSQDLATGAQAEMIVSATTQTALQATQELLKNTAIWPVFTPFGDLGTEVGVAMANSLRTVTSFVQGLTYGYMQKSEMWSASTWATAWAHTNTLHEYLLHALIGQVQIPVGVRTVLAADLLLCASSASRNFEVGRLIGAGDDPEHAKGSVPGVAECFRNIEDHAERIEGMELPYYLEALQFVRSEITLEQAAASILARRERRFE
jgi:glycerol-3-phosphate dehydrogenase